LPFSQAAPTRNSPAGVQESKQKLISAASGVAYTKNCHLKFSLSWTEAGPKFPG
jgi:hypothetical protein